VTQEQKIIRAKLCLLVIAANWEFDEHGLMRLRIASINDLPITDSEPNTIGGWAAVPTATGR
jgi:hypothetical protein